MRRGPLYVRNGYVIGHVQCDDPFPSYYSHLLEVVRVASIRERLMWFLFKAQPHADKENRNASAA